MTGFISAFRTAIGGAKATLLELSAGLEKAKRQREALERVPPPADEFVLDLEQHMRRGRPDLDLHARLRTLALDDPAGWVAGNWAVLFPHASVNAREVEAALAWLFPEQMRERLKQAVIAAHDGQKTMPRAQRISEIQKLTAEILRLEKQREEIKAEHRKMRSELE